jgi:prophage antirepressor-like protein
MNLIEDVFKYESKNVYYIKIDDELFFRANDVAEMLLYKNPSSYIYQHVDIIYKIKYSLIIKKLSGKKNQSISETDTLTK